ncbi:MAG: hypothetical protein WC179_05060 [Candidatus Cloacimonadaceae bacterium]
MTFTELFQDKELKASEKLSKLTDLVSKVRSAYGNSDVDIDVPYIHTVDGNVKITYLQPEDKVKLAEREIRSITIQAVETMESNQGVILDKEIERLVSTNDVLCNLASSTDSKYI